MKKTLLAVALGAAVGFSGTAYSAPVVGPVNINPDAGGGDPTILVGSLDWSVGNSIATPYRSESGSVANPAVGDLFQIYAQSTLGTFNNTSGMPIGGLQLNGPTAATNYEWTFVTGFQEQVTGGGVASNGAATLNTQTVAGGTNFFEIWYDPNPDANNLAGTGFNNGTRILSGTVDANALGSFTRAGFDSAGTWQGGGAGTPLDGFLANNYDGIANAPDSAISSIRGEGSLSFMVTVSYWDPAFFTDPITALLLDFTTQQRLAYNTTDPSKLFTSAPGGGAPTQAGATNTSIGTCNGCLEGGYGPNQMFQTDPSNAFLRQVPEPATLALLGLGLAGIGFTGRRRKSS